jgi:septum formation inhibitor-activating ATPase MinD
LPPAGKAPEQHNHNVVVLTSPSGGIGLSVFGAMLAWELRLRGMASVMVDADFRAGGLDVLLGIEGEEGSRFGAVDAPLGVVDGESLNRDLPRWEDVGVLAFDPWNSSAPEWWETQAAIRALAEVNDVVVVDAADGAVLDVVPSLARSHHVMAIELSVLGLARAKAHMARIEALDTGGRNAVVRKDSLLVVGMQPHDLRGGVGSLSVHEAAEYLSCEVIGPIRSSKRLQRSLLDGAGIRRLGMGSAGSVRLLAERIKASLAKGGQL